MQSYLPTNYDNTGLVNNYFGGVPSGYDNWEIAGRADFDINSKQRLSYVMAYGVRKNVPFTVGSKLLPRAGVVLAACPTPLAATQPSRRSSPTSSTPGRSPTTSPTS